MYRNILLAIGIIIPAILVLSSFDYRLDKSVVSLEKESTAALLLEWGDSTIASKYPDYSIKGVSAERGRDLVVNGIAEKPDGGRTDEQSDHFVCTSCHNIEREDPDLLKNDPLARLHYTAEKGLPFLQATSLYGAVNREKYYNGDYEKKYGDLVKDAREDIRGAIQLCATECAQGRLLKDWELESVLAYLWEIDLKVDDLELTEKEKRQVLSTSTDPVANIKLVKSRYLKQSEATFVLPPDNWDEGYPYEGDAQNGKLIYENSCLHCHYRQRYSFFHLDRTGMSINHLAAKADDYGRQSIYQVIRWGVPSKSGKPSYMPQYTAEKMSDKMVEDLRAYLETGGS